MACALAALKLELQPGSARQTLHGGAPDHGLQVGRRPPGGGGGGGGVMRRLDVRCLWTRFPQCLLVCDLNSTWICRHVSLLADQVFVGDEQAVCMPL